MRKFHRAIWLPVGVALIGSTLLAACGSSSTGGTSSKTIKIGFLAGDTGNTGQARVWKSAQTEAKKKGVQLTVLNSNRDVATEANNMDQLIAQHVDAIIDDPQDINGSIPAIDRALAAGIPVITEDDAVTGSGTKYRYVGSDYASGAGAELAAQEVIKKLNGAGNVVLLRGPVGILVEQVRTQAAVQTLGGASGIKVVYNQNCPNWNADGGTSTMEDALTKNPGAGSINAVIGEDGPIALGAVEALKRANRLSNVITVGIDGNADELQSILNGQETFSVFQQKEKFGVAAVDEAIDLANKKSAPTRVDVPWILINSNDLAKQYLKDIYNISA